VTYRVGDDATVIYPVTDDATPPGDLAFTVVVRARKSDGTLVDVPDAAWLGSPGAARELNVPLATIPAGLWALDLEVPGGPDLFLGNVYIE
jgi:hypothetical protein